MEAPHDLPSTVNPTVMQHEHLEMHPPIGTIGQHNDHLQQSVSSSMKQQQRHGKTTPSQLRRVQEHKRADVPRTEAKVNMSKTHGRPQHPIWQFFTHAHLRHEEKRGPPHVKPVARDRMDVLCDFCGAHIHQEHKLKKGDDEAGEEIRLARSVLHGMWVHLANQCANCPGNVRHDMKTWQPLPKETRAVPAATATLQKASDTAEAASRTKELENERSEERGGYEDDTEGDGPGSAPSGHGSLVP